MQTHAQQLILVLFIVLLAACGSAGTPSEDGSSSSSPSSSSQGGIVVPTLTPGPAPTRPLVTLEGEEVTLDKWRGKGIILNFWATWCYPCRQEMPHLAAIHQTHEDIVVVGVNYLENAENARDFVEEFGLPFPIIVDQRGGLVSDLKVKGLPTTFFINPQGQLIGQHIGELDEEQLKEAVEQLTTTDTQ